jgi:NAD(P)-dependent dehydrogenase (short-subunit alcohol dehydrogenase family)
MLTNSRVVVIGGSSGMGLATAKLLSKEGAQVIIASRSRDKLKDALPAISGISEARQLDFSKEDEVQEFFNSLGAFNHLVLMAAGKPAWGKLSDIQSSVLESAFKTKFWGYFLCAKYGAPHIREKGSILFTIGGAARSAIAGTAGVASVNGAIMCMAMTLAKELAPIRVNVLSPGLVDTPAYNWMSTEEKKAFFRQMGGNLPVGRVGQPDDLAQAALYLISNSFTTGAILDVDGGGRLH